MLVMARKPLDSDSFQKSRSAANARERIRMRILTRAFARLKMSLPWVPKDTKLSKLDTLRLATCYIRYLRQVLSQSDAEEEMIIPDCTKMIWPSRPCTSAPANCEETLAREKGREDGEEHVH